MTRRLVLPLACALALSSFAGPAQGTEPRYDDALSLLDELVRLNGLDEPYHTLTATLAGYGLNPQPFAPLYFQRRSKANALHGDPAALVHAADTLTTALNSAAQERDLIGAYSHLLGHLALDVPQPQKPDAETGTEVVKAILRALKAEAEESPKALFHAEAARVVYKMDEPIAADVLRQLAHDAKVEMCDRLLTMPNVLIIVGDEARYDENSVRLCNYANAVNWPRLYAAAGQVVALTDPDYLARLRKVLGALEEKKPGQAILYEKESTWGRIVFAGSGDAQHEITDESVIIDLGGNDTYVLAAGTKPPVLIIDFAGNDTYRAEGDVGFACGRFGASVLVDLEGEDTYETAGYALGVGLFGVGVLADYAGDDTYTCNGGFVQGAAAFGIGLLVDGGGRDTYKAHIYAQGFGLCDAAGALVELGGDDTYEAGGKHLSPTHYEENDESFRACAMGFGMGLGGLAVGGTGILSDAAGDDRYLGDSFSGASALFYGLGILADHAGNDQYRAFRHGLGASLLYGNAVLLDAAGNDAYELRFGEGLGCGRRASTGLLLDGAGNDTYTASRYYDLSTDKYNRELCVVRSFGGNLTTGAGAEQAIGILIDEAGDDRYVCHNARGQGFAPPFGESGSQSGEPGEKEGTKSGMKGAQFGFLIDRGGADYYSVLHENNSRWTNKDATPGTTSGGLGADYEAAAAGALPEPAARRAYVWDLGSSGEVASFREVIDVSYADNFITMTANSESAAFSPTLYTPIPAEYNKMVIKLWANRETTLRLRFNSPDGIGGVSPSAKVKEGFNELKLDLGRAPFQRTDQDGVVAWGGPSKQVSVLTIEPADRGGVQIKLRSITLFK